MGSEVEKLAAASGHDVIAMLRSGSSAADVLPRADVAVDFTRPAAVMRNIRAAVDANVPIVVGTTGWYEGLDEARRLVEESRGALVYGANFSIGANLFFALVETAARLFDPFPDYDPYVLDHHHRAKADAPSGTAQKLGEKLLERMARKSRVVSGNPEGAIAPDALHVASVRAGAAFGRHEVGFDGPTDAVTIVHEARSREGFARGALYAAEWVRGKTGFYEFREILSSEVKS
jgi:4-hydroxy-tetrahydrodipicolinate reductase